MQNRDAADLKTCCCFRSGRIKCCVVAVIWQLQPLPSQEGAIDSAATGSFAAPSWQRKGRRGSGTGKQTFARRISGAKIASSVKQNGFRFLFAGHTSSQVLVCKEQFFIGQRRSGFFCFHSPSGRVEPLRGEGQFGSPTTIIFDTHYPSPAATASDSPGGQRRSGFWCGK